MTAMSRPGHIVSAWYTRWKQRTGNGPDSNNVPDDRLIPVMAKRRKALMSLLRPRFRDLLNEYELIALKFGDLERHHATDLLLNSYEFNSLLDYGQPRHMMTYGEVTRYRDRLSRAIADLSSVIESEETGSSRIISDSPPTIVINWL